MPPLINTLRMTTLFGAQIFTPLVSLIEYDSVITRFTITIITYYHLPSTIVFRSAPYRLVIRVISARPLIAGLRLQVFRPAAAFVITCLFLLRFVISAYDISPLRRRHSLSAFSAGRRCHRRAFLRCRY